MRTPEQQLEYNAKRKAVYWADPERARAVTKAWRKAHPEKCAEMGRRWRLAHPEQCKAKDRARYLANPQKYNDDAAKRRRADPEGWNAQARARHYLKLGIDPTALPPRPKKCSECGRGGKIVADHCHRGKQFRGWICHSCNVILGLAHDNPATLRLLAAYLERRQTCS